MRDGGGVSHVVRQQVERRPHFRRRGGCGSRGLYSPPQDVVCCVHAAARSSHCHVQVGHVQREILTRGITPPDPCPAKSGG